MKERVIFKQSDLPKSLDICSYMIYVTLNDNFHIAYLFEDVSGTFMHDIVPDYRKMYPEAEGYEVFW